MIVVSKELEQEFTKVISSVTKEITESVVRDSALASVKELNESLQALKKDSPRLVKDIEKAEAMYADVSQHALDNMQRFADFISSWQEQQSELLKEIGNRNDMVSRWLQQSEKRRIENVKSLQHQGEEQKKELDDIRQGVKLVFHHSLDMEKKINAEHLEQVKTLAAYDAALSSKLTTLKVLAGINFVILAALAGYTIKGIIGG
ncbi:MAG: hypothetical protein MR395_10330 [Caecibacter massiliensis]|uniref:hypothetical protein n=1 Tax=unclassified Megasphaera TaxID=2626256 RepID=UPI0012432A0F|nr:MULTISPECIES: hypothetical protein [unclassified Megasphaera]MCI5532986.1 hypothetical protein [Caecibacter massiliensis]MDY2904383.1 hypothetical protein [Caecibacter massiliensis]